MSAIAVGGKQVEVNEHGFVVNLSDWSREVGESMARGDGLYLTDSHWKIIDYLRDYYYKYQVAPMIKIIAKEVGKSMGQDKGNTRYLYELFPGGPAMQACRYAGLPTPNGCI